jgi:Deoxyribonuclease II
MKRSIKRFRSALIRLSILLCALATLPEAVGQSAPTPLLEQGHPAGWWFVFKFNAASFPSCGGVQRQCIFGGDIRPYASFGQQYVFASSENHRLQKGGGCAGDTTTDPVGATFDQVYNGSFFYVIWNDQFYDDPEIPGCSKECGKPWGHSKGMLAWNSAGEGFVLQITTPSWPASGSKSAPRQTDGNTLGCVRDNDVLVSQHFFALKLTKDDLIKVLAALANASIVTDPSNRQIVNNGGPQEIRDAVEKLGKKSASTRLINETLSSGIVVISKPSHLNVPPWQMVSAVLHRISLRTATWWANPKIDSTDESSEITCWDETLTQPGAIEIATSGQWADKTFGLTGGAGPNFNHAKLGVSISGTDGYSIFGDMNQQGTIVPADHRPCSSSQNGRGGLFYVLNDAILSEELKKLMTGGTAPIGP